MMINSLDDIQVVAAYLRRIGAEVRSLRTAVVREERGNYWRDRAVIRLENDGTIDAPETYAPTDAEAAAIKEACKGVEFPTAIGLDRLGASLPQEIASAKSDDIFEFRDLRGRIVLVQVRVERKGEKSYLPFTYWSDNKWRMMEPEGKLPLFGLDQLKDNTTVFIHEGAKAAKFMRDLVAARTPEMKKRLKEHPWGEELSNAAHIGWIGGALSPQRTDWSAIMRAGVKRAYIVSDNDIPGVSAVPAIAMRLHLPTFQVQFTSEFPASFDLADPFPDKMYNTIEAQRYYNGPAFRSMLHPATWATEQKANAKGKPTTVLREHFKEMWTYIENSDTFVCIEMPNIILSESIMNKILAPFSHTNATSQLLIKAYTGRNVKLCYRPDMKGRIVTNGTTSAVNLHVPTTIKSAPGNAQVFEAFLEYLFPNEDERHEVKRWCATLIARPEVHMEYGMLLVSEKQGIGKTTLGSSILAPLVGMQNVGFPSEGQITNSEFNGWIANKRLCVVNEIYGGQNWKAYNRLKSAITDREVEVNEKYQRSYTIENWVHVFACSNSTQPIKIEQDDRRWFYPEVTERKWPPSKFEFFHSWINSGGLSIIKHWAEHFGDYVRKGEPAPMTERKKELVTSSRTNGQTEANDLALAMNREPTALVVAMKEVKGWVEMSIKEKLWDTDLQIRKAMKDAGIYWTVDRYVLGNRLQYAGLNETAVEAAKKAFPIRLEGMNIVLKKSDAETPDKIGEIRTAFAQFLREKAKGPNDIMSSAM